MKNMKKEYKEYQNRIKELAIKSMIEQSKEITKCEYCGEKPIVITKNFLGTSFEFNKLPCNCDEKIKQEKEKINKQIKYKKRLEEYPFLIDFTNTSTEMFKKLDSKQLEIVKKLRKYQESLENGDNINLYFFGKSGVGKTNFVKKLAVRLTEVNIECEVVNVQKLFTAYKNSFNKNTEILSTQTEYGIDGVVINSKKVIILDDVGLEKPTEWTISKLIEIMNYRTENKLTTIITSNYSPSQLAIKYSKCVDTIEADRLVSRMVYNTKLLELKTKNYRYETIL